MDETPIFDQLASERGYNHLTKKKSEEEPFKRMHPIVGAAFGEKVSEVHQAMEGLRKAGTTSKEALEKAAAGSEALWDISENYSIRPVDPVLSENYHPGDLGDMSESEFVAGVVKRYNEKYPWVTSPLDVSHTQDPDGTSTITVRRAKQTDESVNAAKPQPLAQFIKLPEVHIDHQKLMQGIIDSAKHKFMYLHPHAMITSMRSEPDDDGGLKVVFEGVEPKSLDQDRLSFFEGVVAARHMADVMKNENVDPGYLDEIHIDQSVVFTNYPPEDVPTYDDVVAAYNSLMAQDVTNIGWVTEKGMEEAHKADEKKAKFEQRTLDYMADKPVDPMTKRGIDLKRRTSTWGSDGE